VAQVGYVITEVGTRGAAFVFVGAEHEVVDQKLLATFEEILERDFAGWTFECVVFCEFDHGQLSDLCSYGVSGTSGLLLFDEKGSASGEPLFSGDYLRPESM
jgi:hypothetical protein